MVRTRKRRYSRRHRHRGGVSWTDSKGRKRRSLSPLLESLLRVRRPVEMGLMKGDGTYESYAGTGKNILALRREVAAAAVARDMAAEEEIAVAQGALEEVQNKLRKATEEARRLRDIGAGSSGTKRHRKRHKKHRTRRKSTHTRKRRRKRRRKGRRKKRHNTSRRGKSKRHLRWGNRPQLCGR
jgi:hypothetical protein